MSLFELLCLSYYYYFSIVDFSLGIVTIPCPFFAGFASSVSGQYMQASEGLCRMGD
jgi:hypothetical protein